MKKTLAAIILIAICATLTVSAATAKTTDTPGTCLEEGSYFSESSKRTCCANLTAIQKTTLSRRGRCIAYTGEYVCARCGDGFCDKAFENKCNCPQDCSPWKPVVIKTKPCFIKE